MAEDWEEVDLDSTGTDIEIEIETDTVEDALEHEQEIEIDLSTGKTKKPAKPVVERKAKKEESYEKENEDKDSPEELEGIETKGAQKRIRQLIKQRKEREEEVNVLREEMKQLRNAVSQKEEELTYSLKNSIDSSERSLSSDLERARETFKQAADLGDTERMLQAQEDMSKAYATMQRVEEQKRQWDAYYNQVQAARQQQLEQANQQVAPQQRYDPKAVDWASKNDWFGQDQIRTTAALQIDNELKSEGYDPSDDDFYEEVDRRLRNKFPHKYENAASHRDGQSGRVQGGSSSPAQVVAGASRTPKTAKNSVKLTKEQVAMAESLGVPLERYAARILQSEDSDGEYTII